MVLGKRCSHGARMLFTRHSSNWKFPATTHLSRSWRLATVYPDRPELRFKPSPSPASPSPQFATVQNRLADGFLHYKRKELEEPRPRRKSRKHRDTSPASGAPSKAGKPGPAPAEGDDPPQILVVDATELRDYWKHQRQHAGDGKQNDRKAARLDKDVPTPKNTMFRIKNPYTVPFCHGPNDIMSSAGAFQPQQHQLQQQQQQQQHQPQLQHHQQQQYQPPQQQQKQSVTLARESHHGYPLSLPKYFVPLESLYSNPKPGCRYCGNFYYV